MKEKISSEINSVMSTGTEYTAQTFKSALYLAESIRRSFWGETILERSGGRWVPRTVKPGIRHLRSIIR